MAPGTGINTTYGKTGAKINLFLANSNADTDVPNLGTYTRCGL